MRIAIGSDHAGFLLKEHLKDTLKQLGHSVDDHGTNSEASVDYPPICLAVARAVAEGRADRGIVLGGSGQGEQIAANKVRGHPRGALQRSVHGAPVARAQRRKCALDGWTHRGVRTRGRDRRALAHDGLRRRPPPAAPRSDCRGREAPISEPRSADSRTPDGNRHNHPSPCGARWRRPTRRSRRRIRHELQRQNNGLELIASENFVSRGVLEAAGSVLTNKYAEGYPGKRYYGGCEFVDVAERAAIARAKALFGADHANVQPHSGAQANMAVYMTLLKPGDTVLGMNLAHGGHLTHGHPLNFSGQLYTIVPYGVRKDDERIDYDELGRLADEHRPKMIIVGASAYPRVIDFARIRAIADRVGRRAVHRHGAHRRAGRGGHPSESGAALRLRHDHDAQDAARPARRHGAVPRAVREGPRSQRVPRRAGRTADAHHRGQGRVLQGSGRAGVRDISAPDRRQREQARGRAVRRPGSGSSAAAPTTT